MRTELVTTLKRKATDLLAEIRRDKEPILITQHGLPSAYLVDVESFERLVFRMNLLEGIARGERAVEEGRTLSHDEANERVLEKLVELYEQSGDIAAADEARQRLSATGT